MPSLSRASVKSCTANAKRSCAGSGRWPRMCTSPIASTTFPGQRRRGGLAVAGLAPLPQLQAAATLALAALEIAVVLQHVGVQARVLGGLDQLPLEDQPLSVGRPDRCPTTGAAAAVAFVGAALAASWRSASAARR